MRRFGSLAEPELVGLLASGAIGVIRTDTLYGLVANALDEEAVARVYQVKGRNITKPPIVLVASYNQLYDQAPSSYKSFLDAVWPGPSSVVIPTDDAPAWLSRGSGAIAYRIPDAPELLSLLKRTGPLVAPSANPEGQSPARTIDQALAYFGESVDFYVDSGEVEVNQPSALYKFNDKGQPERLR